MCCTCIESHVQQKRYENVQTHFTIDDGIFMQFQLCSIGSVASFLGKKQTGSTKVILGFACNMAKTHFSGRDYVAWYSVDIPLPYGSYKFYGLPGLIVKVEDSMKSYIWELAGVSNAVRPIYQYSYEGEKTYRKRSCPNNRTSREETYPLPGTNG